MDERSAADKQQKESDNAYKTAIIARDQRAIELDRLERDCRKKLEQACYSYNKALVKSTFFLFPSMLSIYFNQQLAASLSLYLPIVWIY